MVLCKYCGKEFGSRNAVSAHAGKVHKEQLLNEPVRIQSRYSDDYLDISYKELNEKRIKHSGKCDVCGKLESANTRPDTKSIPNDLCIDHDHISKKFRGFCAFNAIEILAGMINTKLKLRSMKISTTYKMQLLRYPRGDGIRLIHVNAAGSSPALSIFIS